MAIAQSKLTSQAQVSIPAGVREKLGIGPGSLIEWDEEDGKVVVRRKGQYTFEDIHSSLFPDGPPKRLSGEEMKEAIRERMRRKYARR